MLKYGTTKKSNAQITLEQYTMTTTMNSVKSIHSCHQYTELPLHALIYIYIYIYAYITDAYTLLLHVLALLECYHQGIFTAAVLKKWSDVGGDFVHMLCTYSSAFKVGFIS